MAWGLLSQFHLRHGSTTTADVGPATEQNSPSSQSGEGSTPASQGGEISQGRHATSMTLPSSPHAQRRPCSESMEVEAQQEQKHLKQFGISLCRTKGLPEDALDDFAVLSSKEMMITVHVDMLKLHAQRRKSQAEQFVESEEFKVYAKQNLSTFKILEVALEDPEMTEYITSLISHLLTSARSNMKQKIANHIVSKSHISVLAKSLAPGGGYEMTTAHWACIAFLHDSMIVFKSVVEDCKRHVAQKKLGAQQSALAAPDHTDENEEEQGENNSEGNSKNAKERTWMLNEYWEYINMVLHELRAEACAAETTPVARAKHMEAYVDIIF
ncbi:hypothetical protein PAXRUDRAFT_15880 [Paxillus rubicundulus Ve08.2h10]|uniref:Uncharacterized protein n=1 Tax=Paxillus rubicundulus Ve08.2h10 TaxID=930991 RepID=A0A0D0DGA6_9AGAM|nr:hypothetical protein PAXRUDRAFT_15880 [Paxillus rubicundulus Ve08.2h10]